MNKNTAHQIIGAVIFVGIFAILIYHYFYGHFFILRRRIIHSPSDSQENHSIPTLKSLRSFFAPGLSILRSGIVQSLRSFSFFKESFNPYAQGLSKHARQWHEYVDVIYYINLDSREDRNQEFLEEMRKMEVPDEKIVRISAVSKPGKGDWGCSLSHILTMQQFVDSGLNTCIVFEDDFVFTQDLQSVNTEFREVEPVVYDVVMLSANEIQTTPTEHKFLQKVEDAQTTSGYMVTKNFAPILMQNYRDGAKLIEDSYKIGKSDALQGPFCIDQYWKRLQPQSNWFVFSPKLGVQRESHSDIQGGVINPGV